MHDCITCIAIADKYFFIGSKDGNIYKCKEKFTY